MYEYAENRQQAVELANRCLSASDEAMEPLWLYQFEDDVEAHDETLQERLEGEFQEAWRSVTEELSQTFGPESSTDDADEVDWVPLGGVGGASWWETDRGRLWVAYAHEDRETPYLLMIGKADL